MGFVGNNTRVPTSRSELLGRHAKAVQDAPPLSALGGGDPEHFFYRVPRVKQRGVSCISYCLRLSVLRH